MGWGRGVKGNRWKVNGPGADPPDAPGLDIWAGGGGWLVQGGGFQRYIISFEEQHHSGRQHPPLPPTPSPAPTSTNNPPQLSICPVIDDTRPPPPQHNPNTHNQKYSIVTPPLPFLCTVPLLVDIFVCLIFYWISSFFSSTSAVSLSPRLQAGLWPPLCDQ